MTKTISHKTNKYDGIITNFWFTPNNYGAILSAYAIQQFFAEEGLDCVLLNYNIHNWKESFAQDFKQTYLKLTHKINSISDLKDLNNCTDLFIAGTDQVFRYEYIRKVLPVYTLAYTNLNKKRIAFSASFGTDSFNTKYKYVRYFFKKCLQRFDAVSVREASGIKLCKENFNLDVQNILDPVFLINKTYWDKLAEKASIDVNNKIVSYILDETEEVSQIYDFLKTKYKKDVIKLLDTEKTPEEFLSSIRDSEYFITDSFHGVCFALIFNKKVICLVNESRGGSRFENLIQKFGIDSIFYKNFQEIKSCDNLFKTPDTEHIQAVITKERTFARDWLKNKVNSPKKLTFLVCINEIIFKILYFIYRWYYSLKFEIPLAIREWKRELKYTARLKKLLNQTKKSKIVFWGASLFLKKFLSKNNLKDKNILGIVDMDSEKRGLNYGGYTVYSPVELAKLKPDYVIFTIRNNHEEIYQSVQSYLVENYTSTELLPDIFKK